VIRVNASELGSDGLPGKAERKKKISCCIRMVTNTRKEKSSNNENRIDWSLQRRGKWV